MRMLIQATDDVNFNKVRVIVTACGELLLESRRRLFLSADSLPDAAIAEIRRTGAEIYPEEQFSLER